MHFVASKKSILLIFETLHFVQSDNDVQGDNFVYGNKEYPRKLRIDSFQRMQSDQLAQHTLKITQRDHIGAI